MFRFSLCGLVLLAGLSAAADLPPAALVKDLLALPVPEVEPETGPARAQAIARKQDMQAPSDDAPLERLAGYWADLSVNGRQAIPPRTQQRLLDACEAEPRYLPALIKLLPDTPAAHARIKALLDAELKAPRFNSEWTAAVRAYLTNHSRYFIADLVAKARAAHDEDGWLIGKEDVETLAKLDWSSAEPVLRAHAATDNSRTAVLSLGLLYKHAVSVSDAREAAAYRDRLKRIVEDRARPGRSRDLAAEALLESDWEGRDRWYWSLFRDPTLRDLQDGSHLMAPLCRVGMEVNEWIRQLAERAAGADRTLRDAAVNCLVQFRLDSARRDALLPLLPWLADPKWSSARDRLRLIQSMDRLEMPESVPGLIAVLGQKDETEASYAAESLAHYKDPRAIPALRTALDRIKGGNDRMRVALALVACGGIGPAQAVRSVEAYAAAIATSQGAEELHESLYGFEPVRRPQSEVLIGMVLSTSHPPRDEVAIALLERARSLDGSRPAVAKKLLEIVGTWPGATVNKTLLDRIAGGRPDARIVELALLRRRQLREAARADLEGLCAGGGVAGGLAAVLLGEKARMQAVLAGSDTLAQAALLAAARLTREDLALDALEPHLRSSAPLLAAAAEAYLIGQDTPEARRLVLARHRGEAMILGFRQRGDPGHFSFPALDAIEAQLRQEARAGGELYALLSAGYWGDAGQIIVRLGQNPEVRYEKDPARYHSRPLSQAEVAALREFIATSGIEDRGPLNTRCTTGCSMSMSTSPPTVAAGSS